MNHKIIAALTHALNSPAVLQALNEALGGALDDAGLAHLNDTNPPLAVTRFEDEGDGTIGPSFIGGLSS